MDKMVRLYIGTSSGIPKHGNANPNFWEVIFGLCEELLRKDWDMGVGTPFAGVSTHNEDVRFHKNKQNGENKGITFSCLILVFHGHKKWVFILSFLVWVFFRHSPSPADHEPDWQPRPVRSQCWLGSLVLPLINRKGLLLGHAAWWPPSLVSTLKV